MIVSDLTSRAIAYRRAKRKWLSQGYEEVGEGGGRLWELYRGCRMGHVITDAQIAPGGMSLFVKIEKISAVSRPKATG